MRWPATPPVFYGHGSRRVRTFFALWPRRCGQEIVWFERIEVLEEYRVGSAYDSVWASWFPIEYRLPEGN